MSQLPVARHCVPGPISSWPVCATLASVSEGRIISSLDIDQINEIGDIAKVQEFESVFGTSLGASPLQQTTPLQPQKQTQKQNQTHDLPNSRQTSSIDHGRMPWDWMQACEASEAFTGKPQEQTQKLGLAEVLPQADDAALPCLSKVLGLQTDAMGSVPARHAPGPDRDLSHLDHHGRPNMVDVSQKSATHRSARASAVVNLGVAAFTAIRKHTTSKGDVLAVAQLAGIMAAKQTASLIPLCHNIPLSKVNVSIELQEDSHSVLVTSEVICFGATGVEMEALTAAAVSALTVYDMCKSVSKDIQITYVQLEHKSGGKSGMWSRT